MRIMSLIGTICVLILPFAYISLKVGDFTSTGIYAFFWTSGEVEIGAFQGSTSESFSIDWFEDGNYYDSIFGDLKWLGVVVLVLLVVNLVLASTASDRKNNTTPAIILIVCGVLLLIIRLVALSDNDLGFYSKNEGFFGIETTYIEFPLGFILALVFGILDFRSN